MNTLIYKMVSDIDKLSQDVVQLLRKNNNVQLAVAESCTGGWLSGAVASVSGSSEVFGFGLCAYANEAKVKYLGVNPKTLSEYGAVSGQTALEMARGARNAGIDVKGSCSDSNVMGISTSGIAGPGGGTDFKPVGTVHFACIFGETEKQLHLIIGAPDSYDGGLRRSHIRLESVRQALILCRDTLIGGLGS